MAPAPLSSRLQPFTLLPTIKLSPSGAGSRVGGLVQPLWVSPTTSPVRLGVSPAATPTPMGVFSQRFEALFPCAGSLGCSVCFAPRSSSRFIYAQMWSRVVLPAALPAPLSATLSLALSVYLRECGARRVCQWSDCLPLLSHTPPVLVPPQPHESSPPWCPSPPLLPVWMNVHFFISLVSDFLAVRFSVSSGCARRRSVSTYAAILVLPQYLC